MSTFDNFYESIKIDTNYSNRKGFDRNFLGTELNVPQLNDEQIKHTSKIPGGDNYLLNYHHYSLVINSRRKLPFFTAVNIDGFSYNALRDTIPSRKEIGADTWFFDKRINKEDQIALAFYKSNNFDLGHLVRREDSLWGEDLQQAIDANNDTFHLTNAAPQHKDFNRNAERWKGLEDYILRNARNEKELLRLNVFSGPIFDNKDKFFTQNKIKVQIPAKFWKVITIIKSDGELSSTGYMISQYDLIEDMFLEGFTFGKFRTFQRPIRVIEQLTGLNFNLSQYDPLANQAGFDFKEGNKIIKPRLISAFSDIIL